MLERLEEVARAATPGRWVTTSCGDEECWCRMVRTEHTMPEDVGQSVVSSGSAARLDAEHIAAFDPPTVLALIAVCKAARALVTNREHIAKVDAAQPLLLDVKQLRAALEALGGGRAKDSDG